MISEVNSGNEEDAPIYINIYIYIYIYIHKYIYIYKLVLNRYSWLGLAYSVNKEDTYSLRK